MIGQTAAQRRLSRGVLAQPGRDDIAHDAFVHDCGIEAGAADGLGDHERAELGRSERFERAQELACRGADGADDDGFTHNKEKRAFYVGGVRTVMLVTVSLPRSVWSRVRMTSAERVTSRAHCGLEASTTSTRPASLTDVTRSTAGPTAARHAKPTLPGESGVPRSSSTRAPGTA